MQAETGDEAGAARGLDLRLEVTVFGDAAASLT